ncbi:hypothetical protein HGA92_03100 [Candidatus Gracilibacteria bacterium]|nr:hypothetical protein [Candidatus Gracilibacteria bacterium]NUJ99092.1 hypothetical protein [Candidatus Gracilibacteria bacterium]
MLQNEKIIETRICKHCGVSFDITDKDLEFYEKVSPVFQRLVSLKETSLNGENIPLNGGGIKGGVSQSSDSFFEFGFKDLGNGKVKYLIPFPTLCPDCRQQRRLSFRNEGKLYKRKCDLTGNEIISIYSPFSSVVVYNSKDWWSDKWNPLDYGNVFDFEKTFFEQFHTLMMKIPFQGTFITLDSENSAFGNHNGKMKDCYLCFACWHCEKTFYSKKAIQNKNVFDGIGGQKLENCYQIIGAQECYSCFYCINSNLCSNSYFLYDCKNCEYCFACYNLINKKYCIFNEAYSKEDYLKKVEEIKNEYLLGAWEKMSEIIKKAINKNLLIYNCEDSIGDNIRNCKNCYFAYEFENAENCKYVDNGGEICDSVYDGRGVGDRFSLGYEIFDTGVGAVQTCFTGICHGASHTFYSMNCYSCNYLFGCIGLRNKSYCILNKQYTKEEYEALVPKIIEHMMKTGEWGEFFPSSLSPFGYNETVAQEYYPINPEVSKTGLEGKINYIDREGNTYKTLQEARKRPVFKWSNYEAPFPKVEKIIPASKLPNNIADIPDDILNWAIECEITKKPFKIIKEELAFYRKHNLPIPRRHPDQRHLDRMNLRNPRHLYTRNCDKCGKEIQTTYAPERPEIVYCEDCYNKEVY